MKSNSSHIILILLTFLFGYTYGQSDFQFPFDNKFEKIRFELSQNLMVVPVELNGEKLHFILDTGVKETIIFNVSKVDTIQLNNASFIEVKGVNDEVLKCVKSENNNLNVNGLHSYNHVVYVAFNQNENLSAYLGTEIHGILGYHFFKDFMVSISYPKQLLKVYPKNTFKNKWKRYQKIPLIISNSKPYVDAKINQQNVRLLLDTGMSDSLWFFGQEYCDEYGFYEDFLGFTLSGKIEGKRSKIKQFSLLDNKFKDVKIAYPDKESLTLAFKNKVYGFGIIGGEILKRFDVVIDYQNQNLYLKTNQWAKNPFYYNKAGISLRQDGEAVEKNKDNTFLKDLANKNVITYVDLNYLLSPEFIIDHVREHSPAYLVGLQKDDKILEINGKKTYEYSLKTINALFYDEDEKEINITILRGVQELHKKFQLKSPLVKL